MDIEPSVHDDDGTTAQQSQTSSVSGQIRNARPLTSWLHQEMTIIFEKGVQKWKCSYCPRKWAKKGGTKVRMEHLKKAHQCDPIGSAQALKRERKETDLKAVFNRAEETVQAAQVERRRALLGAMINKDLLEYLYIRWTVVNDIPFLQVEHEDFRVFLDYINPAANDVLPRSHNTIRARVITLYEEGKDRVRHILQSAISDIHLTRDLWTSPNHLGLLGITAHFTNEEQQLQALTIGLKEIQGAHSGENQASILLDILEDFKIKARLGYLMLDNAHSNDTCVEVLAQNLNGEGTAFDPIQRRLRCNGHIINLAVQAFLFGRISDDLEYLERLDGEQPLRFPSLDELSKWRKLGPLVSRYGGDVLGSFSGYRDPLQDCRIHRNDNPFQDRMVILCRIERFVVYKM